MPEIARYVLRFPVRDFRDFLKRARAAGSHPNTCALAILGYGPQDDYGPEWARRDQDAVNTTARIRVALCAPAMILDDIARRASHAGKTQNNYILNALGYDALQHGGMRHDGDTDPARTFMAGRASKSIPKRKRSSRKTKAGGYAVWARSPKGKLCITCAEESPGTNPSRAIVTISCRHFCGPHADALVPDWRERKARAKKK